MSIRATCLTVWVAAATVLSAGVSSAQPARAARRPTVAEVLARVRAAEPQAIACTVTPGAGVASGAARIPVEVTVPPGGPARIIVGTAVGAPGFHQCLRLAVEYTTRSLPTAFQGAPVTARTTFAIPRSEWRRPATAAELQGLLRARARAVLACVGGRTPGLRAIPVRVRFSPAGPVERVEVRLPDGAARAAQTACVERALRGLRARPWGAVARDVTFDFQGLPGRP